VLVTEESVVYISDEINQLIGCIKIKAVTYPIDCIIQISMSIKQEGLQVGFNMQLQDVHVGLHCHGAGVSHHSFRLVCLSIAPIVANHKGVCATLPTGRAAKREYKELPNGLYHSSNNSG
jgi:hypothetical protein